MAGSEEHLHCLLEPKAMAFGGFTPSGRLPCYYSEPTCPQLVDVGLTYDSLFVIARASERRVDHCVPKTLGPRASTSWSGTSPAEVCTK